MGRIYRGQSALRITLKTYVNLEGIDGAVIKYKKPNGKQGEFPAWVSDTDNGVIFHEVLEEELNACGWWVFWAFITFADGRTAAGEASKVYIWNQGC